MKADAFDLSTVFELDRQLFAPLFQRPYVWEKEKQWKPFWEDTKTIAEQILDDESKLKPHFLGAVVLEQFKVPINKPDARSIIDGQQRLTTIQIFLAALRDICIGKEHFKKFSRSVERLMFNDKSIVDEEVDRYKVWPTNMDQAAYKIILTTQSPEEAKAELKKHDDADKSNIADAYFYFHNTIKEWALDNEELSKDKLQALVNTIRKGLRIVVVDMGEDDNAQLIFETLNARGTPLLPSDLVKNFLFHQAKKNNLDVDTLYESFWLPFDKAHRFWREKITQGRLKRPRIDMLLQHYLTLLKEDDVSARALFQEFQLIFENKPEKNSEFFLKSLKKHGEYFRLFLTIPQDSQEGSFFHRLKIMDTTTVFPFLLGMYEYFEEYSGNDNDKIRILVTLESYLVRRMICRLSTKNYNRFFLELLGEMRAKGGFSYEAVLNFLSKQTSDTNKWPSDKEFQKAWFNVPIYHAITRPRLRMILIALDRGLENAKTEPYTLTEHLTVEHLMPQLWKDHWPLPEVEEESYEEKNYSIEKRNQLIQTIGNLFYLTKSLNPYISNGPFEEKKEAILEYSAINLNRNFLVNADSWNENSILKRSEDLFQVALKIWPSPDKQIQRTSKSVLETIIEESEKEPMEKPVEPETAQIWSEKKFFEVAFQELGENNTNALRIFYDMAKSSPYEIDWNGEEAYGCFKLHFPQLCAGSIIIVRSNGDIEMNFGNIRGSENAELFKEVLYDDLKVRMKLDISDEFHDKTLKYPSDLWINKSDILMDILDHLLAEYIEIESV